MIRKLTVSNYRSLGEKVEIDLDKFTALVGPNGSGKSSVVDCLKFVADAIGIGLSGAISHRNGIGAVRRWSGGRPFNLAIQLDLLFEESRSSATYSFEIKSDKTEEYRVKAESASIYTRRGEHHFEILDGKWLRGPDGLRPQIDEMGLALPLIGGDERFQPLVQELQAISVYSIFPDTLRKPQKYSPVRPMDQYGATWASILKDQPKDSWRPELVSALVKLTGDTEDIRVTQAAGYLVVEILHHSSSNKKKWFGAGQESDGTLRVAGIITALLQEPSVPVIVIEEPELTVHPGAIPLLVDFMKQASKRSQVIVTTHSPDLLDLLEPPNVRVVNRGEAGTTVVRMSASQRDAVKKGLLSLGEILRTEGIQGEQLPLAS